MGIYRDKTTRSYRYDFRLNGQRYTGRGFRTIRAAEAAEADRRQRVLVGLTGQWPTFSALAQEWLADLGTRASEGWVKQCLWKLTKHAAPIAGLPPSQIRPLTLQRLLAQVANGTSPKAANELRKILGAAFRWAVDMGGLPANPVQRIRKFAVEEPEIDVIPTEDLRALILAADDRLARFLTVQALTAARRVEISRLRIEDCLLDSSPPLIALRHDKGGKGRLRWRPLPALAAEALARQIAIGARGQFVWPGRGAVAHISNEALNHSLRRACERAQLRRYGFHSVRRWAATSAIETGFVDKVVAEFLGHKDTSVTRRYVAVKETVIADIGDRLEAKLTGRVAV